MADEKWLSVNGKFHEFCKKISEAMLKSGDTQIDVSKVTGTDQSLVSRITSGYFRANKVRKVTEGTWQKIVRVGEVYGIEVPTLPQHVRVVRPRKVAEIRVADPKPTPSLGLDRSAILRLTAEGKLSIDTASELLDVIYGVK